MPNSDMFGFPRSGMPTLKDDGDRFCLNTLYDRPLKRSGYVIDAVGNVRFYGDSTLGVVTIPLTGRIGGVTRLTMTGYITGVTDLTMSGNLLITLGEIGNILQRVKKGWFIDIDVKNGIMVDGDPVVLLADLQRMAGIGAITYQQFNKSLVQSAAISTTEIDWSTGAIFTKTIEETTAFTFANLQLNKVITVMVTGEYTLSFPAYCKRISGVYDGTVSNYIQFHCVNAGSGTEEVWYTINQAL